MNVERLVVSEMVCVAAEEALLASGRYVEPAPYQLAEGHIMMHENIQAALGHDTPECREHLAHHRLDLIRV